MYKEVRLDGSTYEFEIGDEVYLPHEGEVINVIPYVSLDEMLVLMEMGETEGIESMRAMADKVCPIVSKIITSWTWTNGAGENMGKKGGNGKLFRPTDEDIRSLPVQEISWIINEFFALINGPEEENPQ